MIGIIDYGAGNLLSVKKAFAYIGIDGKLVRSPEDLRDIDKLVLPGVGAFYAAIEKLKTQQLFEPIRAWAQADRPFLGICLGLQMLFEESDEFGSSPGLGVFRGRVPQFKAGKVPQIGWNQVAQAQASPLWHGIDNQAFFYFLHGFYVDTPEESMIIGQTDYGITYTSAIQRGNIYAVQFHPEKSGSVGLKLLENWVNIG